MNRAVLYARVSSERQAERDLSIPSQLKALRQHAASKGWEIVEEFIDAAESARSADRPEFQRMIHRARKKPLAFDVILVWKLSRFARNREDSILYKSLLRRHGVQVVSLSEPLDESPSGRLLEGMIEVIDEFYSANLAQDALRGMRENASRGYVNGGVPPFGYRHDRIHVGSQLKSKLAIVPSEADIVRRIFAWCVQGLGVIEIAKQLNADGVRTRAGHVWGKTVIHHMLRNETYTGTLLFGRTKAAAQAGEGVIRVQDAHPPVVTKEVFDHVQRLLQERSPKRIHPRLLSSEYLLSGLAYCGWCHHQLTGCSAKSGRFHYYACQSVLKRGRAGCRAKFIPRAKLERAVIEKLKQRVLTEAHLTSLVELVNQELMQARTHVSQRREALDKQVAEVQSRLDRLYGALETDQLSLEDVAPRIKELRRQLRELECRKEQDAVPSEAVRLTQEEIARCALDLQTMMAGGSLTQRKSFLRSFVRRVVVPHQGNDDNGEIEYTLPLPEQGHTPERGISREVLSAVQSGSPLLVNRLH